MSTTLLHKTILIAGASRGLGLGLVREYLNRGWKVIATVRKIEPDSALLQIDASQRSHLQIETLDINESAQIAQLLRRLQGQALDILFVNAGVMNERDETIGEVSTEEFYRVMLTNALSPMRVVESFSSVVPSGGVIAVMSSFLGSIAHNESGGTEVYRASKAALNTLMRSFAARTQDVPRTMIAMSPGWVKTDMGGDNATLDVATSVRGMADVIAAQTGKTGMAFLNYKGETVAW